MTRYNALNITKIWQDKLNLQDFMLNLIGVRFPESKHYRFPDLILVIINILGKVHYYEFSASTKPYLDKIFKADKIGYQGMLLPGYYPDFWKVESRYDNKLIQAYEVPVAIASLGVTSSKEKLYKLGRYGIVKGIDLRLCQSRRNAHNIGEVMSQCLAKNDDMIQLMGLAGLQYKQTGRKFVSYYLTKEVSGYPVVPETNWKNIKIENSNPYAMIIKEGNYKEGDSYYNNEEDN